MHIIPTQAGRDLQAHMSPKVEQIHGSYMQRITPEEWDELNRILNKMAEPAEQRSFA